MSIMSLSVFLPSNWIWLDQFAAIIHSSFSDLHSFHVCHYSFTVHLPFLKFRLFLLLCFLLCLFPSVYERYQLYIRQERAKKQDRIIIQGTRVSTTHRISIPLLSCNFHGTTGLLKMYAHPQRSSETKGREKVKRRNKRNEKRDTKEVRKRPADKTGFSSLTVNLLFLWLHVSILYCLTNNSFLYYSPT